MSNFEMVQGDRLPILTDQLMVDGTPIDLTGARVWLRYSNETSGRVRTVEAAVIPPATIGKVKFEWEDVDTSDIGRCFGSWKTLMADGKSLTIPTRPFIFELIAPPAVSSGIAKFRKYVRTFLGDNHPDINQYAADQIDDAIRTVVNMGKIPGVSLNSDGVNLSPAVEPLNSLGAVDPNWARIVLYASKLFIMPNASMYAFRSRALSEMFGDSAHLVMEVLSEVYELENGEGAF